MSGCYQIRDWDRHFENDRSRNRKHCAFVCVPNKQHGMGFSRIMAEPDGASIYGIWHCIVGACSQQTLRAGWLTDDGDCAVTGWCAEDLSLKFRRPIKEIQRALDFLSCNKVGWLILHKSETSHPEVTTESPQSPLKRREEKEGREEKGSVSLPLSELFDFWNETAFKSGLSQCLIISDQRRRKLEIRLGNEFFAVNWKSAISRIAASRFCRGENDRGWRASLDWFIQPDSVPKIMEGKYDDRVKPIEVERPTHATNGTYDSRTPEEIEEQTRLGIE